MLSQSSTQKILKNYQKVHFSKICFRALLGGSGDVQIQKE